MGLLDWIQQRLGKTTAASPEVEPAPTSWDAPADVDGQAHLSRFSYGSKAAPVPVGSRGRATF